MADLKISQEKKVMKRFLHEVTKTEKSLAVYGETQVRKALQMGVIDTLLLSEELRKYRIKIKCQTCEYFEEKTIDEEKLADYSPPPCPACATSLPMEIVEKIDLIDELSDKAEQSSTKVQLISRESEEGDSLYRAFSGIAGILRYAVDL